MPWSPAPWCASHRTVKLCGVRHTAESIDQKFLKILLCASHRGVKLRCVHHTTELDSLWVCIPPQSLQCASYHTAESSSAVCILPRSQAPLCASHHGVKLHKAESTSKSLSLWLLLKGQSEEILLGMNISIMKEKIRRNLFDFLSLNFDPWCHVRWSRIFRTLWSNFSAKSKPNLKILQPVYQGPRWVQIINKGGRKSRDTLPLRSESKTLTFTNKQPVTNRSKY